MNQTLKHEPQRVTQKVGKMNRENYLSMQILYTALKIKTIRKKNLRKELAGVEVTQ